ncbi:hypothetical protein Drorol1_Dr00011845 [Drosera rotundifolia]
MEMIDSRCVIDVEVVNGDVVVDAVEENVKENGVIGENGGLEMAVGEARARAEEGEEVEKISTVVKAAGVNVEAFWPSLFAKLVEKRNIEDLIMNVGAGGGGAPVAVAAAPAGGAAAAPAAKEKKEEKMEEKEESDGDMSMFSLFD